MRARWLFTQRPVTPCFRDTSSPAEGRGSKHRLGSGRWKQMPPSLGLVPDQKAWGAALWAAAATVFVCSWGSKLVTVSFHLWSWSLSSCWEEEPPCWVGRGCPSPYRGLGTPVRLGEDGWRRAFCRNLWVTMTTRHINASLCFAAGSGMFVFTNVFTAGVRHMS